ncbi:unnamed protein product [Absidia cylindrospora]
MSASNLPHLPHFEQLSERVWRVMGQNPSNYCLQGTNTYLVGLGDRKFLVDTGEGVADYLPLLKRSLKTTSPNAYISDILISHCHHDHLGGLDAIYRSDLNDPLNPIRVHKYPLDLDSQDHQFHMDDFPKDIPLMDLQDRQLISVDSGGGDGCNMGRSTTLQVLHTPGHAADHCCFWLMEENTLFTADCVLGHGNVVFYDLVAYMKSLQVLEKMAPIRLYPGHGEMVVNGLHRIQHYLRQRQDRETQIIEIIRSHKPSHGGAWTAFDIADYIYGDDISLEMQHIIVLGITLHLLKLQHDGRARLLSATDFDHDDLYSMLHKEWCYVGKCRL